MRFKKLIQLMLFSVLTLMIVLLIAFINLPGIINWQAKSRLTDMNGLENLQFEVSRTGLSSARIENISLGKGLSVRNIAIEYRLKGFTDIDIQSVVISGIRLAAVMDENKTVRIEGINLPAENKKKSGEKEFFPFLKFLPRQIEIHNSLIVLNASGDEMVIPFDMTSTVDRTEGAIQTETQLYFLGEKIQVAAAYGFEDGIRRVTAESKQFDLESLNRLIPGRKMLKGGFDFRLSSETVFSEKSSGNKVTLDISNLRLVSPAELSVDTLNSIIVYQDQQLGASGSLVFSNACLADIGFTYGFKMDFNRDRFLDIQIESRDIQKMNLSDKQLDAEFLNPLVKAVFRGTPEKLGGNIKLKADRAVINQAGDTTTVSDLELAAHLDADVLNRKISSVVNMDANSMRSSRSGIKTGRVSIKLPMEYPRPERKNKGEFKFSDIVYDQKFHCAIDGEIGQTGPIDFALTGLVRFKDLDQIELKFHSDVGVQEGLYASAGVTTGDISISQTGFKKYIPKDYKGILFGMKALVEARLDYKDGKIKSSGMINLDDGSMELPEKDISLSGVNGEIHFDDLLAVKTAPGQEIKIKSISMNKIQMEDAKIRFSLETSSSLLLENIRFRWCNGLVSTESIRLKKGDDRYALSLYCDRLELAGVLKQMGAFNAEGTGTLNGRIPVVYDNKSFSFENGFLFSTPGSTGTIIVSNAEKLTQGIPMNTPQFSQLDLAQEALKDFSYNWAKLLFNTEKETLVVNMELDGKPSRVLPFEYSKEFGGFARVDASSPGSNFQGIKLDVNLKLPFNEILKSGNKLKSLFK